MAQPTIKELLGQVERAGRRLEGLLRALDQVLQEAEARGETAVTRDTALGPELPNGEGIGHETVGQRTERAILDVIAPEGAPSCQCGHGIHAHRRALGFCSELTCACGGFRTAPGAGSSLPFTDPRD